MIKISVHPNFCNWLNVSVFGKVVDQATCQAKALQIAKDLARKNKQRFVLNEGKILAINEKS
jgi:hypothetical protein